MAFNKKIFLIWGVLFGLGTIVNLLLILVSYSYILGWLWSGIGNIIFLITILFLFRIRFAKGHKSNLKIYGSIIYFAKAFINLLAQAILCIFLFLINYWTNGSWDKITQGPINLFSFVVAIALPGIALIISLILREKGEAK